MHAERPPTIDLRELERRARHAYERGRLRHALLAAWPVLALAALALVLGGRPWAVVPVALVLLALVVALLHRGGPRARAVVPGLLGGSLPMLAGLLSCRVPHACAGPGCLDGCMLICFASAVLGGAFVARSCHAIAPGDRDTLVAGGIVAALAGGLGCIVVGTAGLAGLALGLATVAVPTLIRATR